jgi:hypothetical protein
LNQSFRTADIMQQDCTQVGTTQMGDLICATLRETTSRHQG